MQPTTKRRWYSMRWWYVCLLIVLVPVAGYLQHQIRGEWELARVLAKWDAEGVWHWEEVIANRPAVADDDNLSLLITRMANAIKNINFYSDPDSLFDSINQQPNQLLSSGALAALQRRRKDAAPFFEQLPRFRAMSGLSRLQFQIKTNPWDTLLPIQEHREAFNRLHDQFRLELAQGNYANALAHLEDQLKISRSLSHEPNMICYLVYLATESLAAQNTQHWLAQSQPDEASLLKMQKYFSQEEDDKHWRYLMRSEAGGAFGVMQYLKHDPALLEKAISLPKPSSEWWGEPLQHVKFHLAKLQLHSPWQTADMMQVMHVTYQQAEKPPSEQMAFLIQQVEKLGQEQGFLPFTAKSLMMPAWQKVLRVRMRLAAQKRCVMIALAAERFRLAHQRWPASQEELVGKYLPKVLTDPFDNQPIRYKPLPDGVVIYSIGAQIPANDKDDEGDVLTHEDGNLPKDTGIRLWNVVHRRQPTITKPKEEKPEVLKPPGEDK
jgi:hypothetical protein